MSRVLDRQNISESVDRMLALEREPDRPRVDSEVSTSVDNVLRQEAAEAASLRVQTEISEPPGQRAKAIGISRQVGVPLQVVEENLPRYENRARLRQAGFGFVQSVPPLRRLMSDPELGPVALADLESLSTLARDISLNDPSSPGLPERETGLRVTLGGILSGRFRQGLFTVRQGKLGSRVMFGLAGADEQREFHAMRRLGVQPPGNLPGPLDDFLGVLAEQVPILFNIGLSAAEGAALGAVTGAAIGAPGGPAGAVAIGTAAAVVAGISGGALASFELEGGIAYGEFLNIAEQIKRESGEIIPPDAILGAAVFVGSVNAALEFVGFKAIAALVPGASNIIGRFTREGPKAFLQNAAIRDRMVAFARQVGRAGLTEGLTEGTQETVGVIGGNTLITLATIQDPDLITMEDFVDRVLPAAGQGAMAGIGFGGAFGSIGVAATEINRAATATKRAQRLDALVESLKDSELLEQLPESFAEFANELAEQKGEDQNVYIDAGEFVTYFQGQGIDLESLRHVMPALLDQLGEATAAGGDLVIPMGDYLAHLGPEHHEGLRESLRTGIGEASPREVATLAEDLPQKLEAEIQAETIARAEAVAIEESADQVFDDVLEQLVQAGQAPEVARAQAMLVREAAKTRALRLGRTDVFDLFRGLNLEIVGPVRAEPAVRQPRPALETLLAGLRETGKAQVAARTQLERLLAEIRGGLEPEVRGLPKQPVLTILKRRGGVDPTSGLASELEAIGVQRRGPGSVPGLFRKGGLQSLDALADLTQEPIFAAFQPIEEGGTRLDPQDLLNAIQEELQGRPIRSEEQLEKIEEARRPRLELVEAIEELGIDVEKATPAQVERQLSQLAEPRITLEQEQILVRFRSLLADARRTIHDTAGLEAFFFERFPRAVRVGDEITTQDTPSEIHGDIVRRAVPAFRDLRIIDMLKRETAEGVERGFLVDGEFVGEEEFAPVLREFDTMIPGAMELFQAGPRGSIQFGPDLQSVVIRLTESQDLSTFLHESGHLFLETLKQDATLPGAPLQLDQDLETALQFLGVGSVGQLRNEHHEKWARAFEQYLFEGKAPSVELQGVFSRFRAWLLRIYRSLRSLGEPLTDEIRDVMDRLLASDQAIETARQAQRFLPAFDSAEAAGMTEAEFAAYERAGDRATTESKQKLDRQVLDEIQRVKRAEWKQARIQVRAATEADINARPVFQAKHWLQTGEMLDRPTPDGLLHEKLSRDILVAQWGKEILKLLPSGINGVWQKTGGMHPDTAADIFGFRSGDHLVRALQAAGNRRQVIEQETDARMLERFGDMLHDGTIEEEALKAASNDAQGNFLLAEQRALAKRAGTQALPATVARQAARRIIEDRRIRDLRVDLYRNAEQRHAKASVEAIARRDWQSANDAKRKQVLNHYLGVEATKARETADKNRDFLSRFDKPKTRERIGGAGEQYLSQIDGLLERFDLRRSVTLRAADRRLALADWITEREAAGDTLMISPELRNEAFRTPWRSLTVNEFQAVTDAAKNIAHLAGLKTKLLASKEKREFEDVVAEITSSILSSNPILANRDSRSPPMRERLVKGLTQIHAKHLKMEFVFRHLDGFKDLGPAWRAFFRPFVEAEAAEQAMLKDVAARFADIFGKITRQERAGWKVERVHIPEIADSLTRESLIAVALNSGNAENKLALKKGEGDWTDAQLEAVLNQLRPSEVQAVNEIWRFVDSFYPQIAEIQRELTGLAPKKVEGEPLIVRGGTLEGGYYPLRADPRRSFLAFKRDEKSKTLDLFESNFMRPQTQKGHTIERVGFGGQPVKLSLSVLTEHLHNVIHDLTHRKALIQVDRLTQDERVRDAIQSTVGREVYNEIRPWLKGIAGDRQALEFAYEKLFSRARAGATIAYMGFKFTTAFAQLAGFLNSADRVGLKSLVKQTALFIGQTPSGMKQQVDFAFERSKLLPNRMKNFDRDARDILKRGGFRTGPLGNFTQDAQRSYLYMVGLFDMAVSIPTWFAGYSNGMEQFDGDESRAIELADQAIRLSQGSGSPKDLASVQRGGELMRMWTFFYSYFSVLYSQGAERIAQIRTGAISLPQAAASTFFLWFGNALIAELLAGRGPREDEEWWKWAAGEITLYPFLSVVGVRDWMGHFINTVRGRPFDFALTPLADVFETTASGPARAIRDIAQEQELRRATARELTEAISFWGKLPGRQAWITGEALYDLLTEQGEVVFPQDFLFPRPPERRANR